MGRVVDGVKEMGEADGAAVTRGRGVRADLVGAAEAGAVGYG
jgi:hypothetical protein